MLGEGTDLTAHGSVQLSGDRALDLTADGRLDLKLLSGFDPDLTSSGLVTMNMTVGGTVADPFPQGHVSGDQWFALLRQAAQWLERTQRLNFLHS